MTLAEQYEQACETPSDIYLHLPRFVSMVYDLNAQHVVELGSRSGVSTVAWLYALERTGGHLTTIDLDPAPEIGTWPRWRHIQGNDLDPDVIAQLEPAEIVFIDTSHTFAQTYAEQGAYRPLVNPGGLLVLHDTMLGYPQGGVITDPRFPVRRAIEKYVAEHDLRWTNILECWGLGIIQL